MNLKILSFNIVLLFTFNVLTWNYFDSKFKEKVKIEINDEVIINSTEHVGKFAKISTITLKNNQCYYQLTLIDSNIELPIFFSSKQFLLVKE